MNKATNGAAVSPAKEIPAGLTAGAAVLPASHVENDLEIMKLCRA